MFLYINVMQPNPYKYQGIVVGKKTYLYSEFANITCDQVGKLLGIDIEYQLNSNKH